MRAQPEAKVRYVDVGCGAEHGVEVEGFFVGSRLFMGSSAIEARMKELFQTTYRHFMVTYGER
jgi:hypothetical protein